MKLFLLTAAAALGLLLGPLTAMAAGPYTSSSSPSQNGGDAR